MLLFKIKAAFKGFMCLAARREMNEPVCLGAFAFYKQLLWDSLNSRTYDVVAIIARNHVAMIKISYQASVIWERIQIRD